MSVILLLRALKAELRRPRPSSMALLIGTLTYIGGYWLHATHELSGAVEPGAPPSLIHWLRDSTLLIPVVVVATYLGIIVAGRLAGRSDGGHARVNDRVSTAAIVALIVSAAEGISAPVHGLLFEGHEAHGAEQSVVGHMIADGLSAIPANLLIAGIVLAIVGGRLWTDRSHETRRRPSRVVRGRGLVAAMAAMIVTVSSGAHLVAAPTAAQAPSRPCPATAPVKTFD